MDDYKDWEDRNRLARRSGMNHAYPVVTHDR